ncbi:MAG: hypothetical protein ABIT38_20430 [Gemmatimonadaceae bacterium]
MPKISRSLSRSISRSYARSLATLGLPLFVACGGGSDAPTASNNEFSNLKAPSTVAEFSVLPVIMPPGAAITPLGHIQPVGHVLPTDHVYFYPVNFDHPGVPDTVTRPVVSPGEGIVTWMLYVSSGRPHWKVMFKMTSNCYYYLDHLLPDPGLKVGSIVHAGDRIGTTDPGGTLDLGAFDLSHTLSGFVTPARYGEQTLHCVSPWKYFTEPLRSSLYARIRRAPTAPDRDGHIDYDIPGRLVGSWFQESLPATVESSGPRGWAKSLAFAYDYYDPSIVRISIGGTIAAPGVWNIAADEPRPVDVSRANGKVAYRLKNLEGSQQSGLMLVEMLAANRIRVQVFEGRQAGTADFDERAQVYLR